MSATSTNIFDFYDQQQDWVAANPILEYTPSAWDAQSMQAAGIPSWATPLGQAPQTAGGIHQMMSEAQRYAGSGALPAPSEGMSAEQYMTFLDLMGGMEKSQAVDQRADTALSQARNVYNQGLGNKYIQQAGQLAGQPAPSTDMFEAMRQSYDANARTGAMQGAYGSAARGNRGSSANILAQQGGMMQRAGDVASMIPQAQAAAQGLQSQQVADLQGLGQAQMGLSGSYIDSKLRAIGALYGNPTVLKGA